MEKYLSLINRYDDLEGPSYFVYIITNVHTMYADRIVDCFTILQ